MPDGAACLLLLLYPQPPLTLSSASAPFEDGAGERRERRQMERDAIEVNLSCRVVGNTQEMAEYDACISNSFAAKNKH